MSTHPSVRNGAYDVARVREDFPALAMKVYGKPLVYLDNAASAQKPNAVLERMTEAYKSEYANVHRGLHYLANAATEAYEGGRAKVAQFLNARRNEEIVFTRNATEAINLVAYSWGEVNIKAGDEIVVSIMEHHSNIVPWHFLRERHGAVIKWAPVDDEGNFLIDEFEKLLTDRTKLVAITHMSNALGTLVPVKEVTKLAHARGIPVLVDGSQGAVHLPVDVQDIDCDFYVFTGHKVYGPTGIGALYAKHEHLVAMRPFNGGGEMIREVAKDWVTYGDPPHKFEAGTPAIVEAIGLGAAIDYVNSIGKARIAAHEHDLVTYAQERLREINSLRLIGTARDKGPVISFEMKGAHPHDVATVIDRQGIAVRAGTHCVMPLLERFNVTATCRASFGMYNTREEVDQSGTGADQGAGIVRMSDIAEVKTSNMETASALPPEETERLTAEIVAALKTVFDPEIPADIYELGLIYKVEINDERAVDVTMTLTTPNCPAAGELPTHGRERRRQRARRRRGQHQPGLGAGLVAGPDERRGAPRAQYVVKRSSMIRKSGHRFSDKIMLNQESGRDGIPSRSGDDD